jgi:hypothetical protein
MLVLYDQRALAQSLEHYRDCADPVTLVMRLHRPLWWSSGAMLVGSVEMDAMVVSGARQRLADARQRLGVTGEALLVFDDIERHALAELSRLPYRDATIVAGRRTLRAADRLTVRASEFVPVLMCRTARRNAARSAR